MRNTHRTSFEFIKTSDMCSSKSQNQQATIAVTVVRATAQAIVAHQNSSEIKSIERDDKKKQRWNMCIYTWDAETTSVTASCQFV